MNFRNFWHGSRHLRPFPDRPDRPDRPATLTLEPDAQTVLGGIQVVSFAARPLTLRVASGYRGGVFFELTKD